MPESPQNDLEELERLEQSITMTLYEIDANFSKCHRIVTQTILPEVERYSDSTKGIWSATKFWKSFFERSANVSLSSYEELAQPDETSTYDSSVKDSTTYSSFINDTDQQQIQHEQSEQKQNKEEQQQQRLSAQHDKHMTPKRIGSRLIDEASLSSSIEPPKTPYLDANSPNSLRVQQAGANSSAKRPDKLLHRVLDNNWKLQATPINAPGAWRSVQPSTPMSGKRFENSMQQQQQQPRQYSRHSGNQNVDSDLDDLPPGMSPPVTMQFAVAPSRLLKTPAKEAAKFVVDDLLRTAGADSLDSNERSHERLRNLRFDHRDSPMIRRK